MIAIRYHPILAFAQFYVPGLLLFVAFMGLVGTLSPAAGVALHKVANIVPLLIAGFAAWRAALPEGRPIYRFTGFDPKAVRADFRKNIWLYAIAFGVLAVLVDLAMVVVATVAGTAEGFHYPILRLWLIAGVYAVISKFAIEHSFTTPAGPAAEEVAKRIESNSPPAHALNSGSSDQDI